MSERAWQNVMVIRHPVIQEHLTIARDKRTSIEHFRRQIGLIARLMAFEITRDYPTQPRRVETPMGPSDGCELARGLTLVPILRAGLGMADGILELVPRARVGHVGICRDETTLKPTVYYSKLPPTIAETDVIIVDPMLATAGSLIAAIDEIHHHGARDIKVLCLVASPEGIGALRDAHADIPVFTAAVDERLDERGFIIPGLGDAGDRLFGTI